MRYLKFLPLSCLIVIGCQSKLETSANNTDIKRTPIEQMLHELRTTHGEFTSVDSGKTMITYLYAYALPDGYQKSKAIKSAIDKSLNIAPVKSNESIQEEGGVITIAEYKWTGPQFEVDMNSNAKGTDSLKVWLWVRL